MDVENNLNNYLVIDILDVDQHHLWINAKNMLANYVIGTLNQDK
jgi:hypothetical protein